MANKTCLNHIKNGNLKTATLISCHVGSERETVEENRRKALTVLDSIHFTLPFTKRKALHEW